MNLGQSYLPYLSHNIQAGYVVSRKYEVGLQYTRIDYSSNFYASSSVYDDNTSTYSNTNIDHRTFTGNNVTAYIKFFRERKGFIAPLGRYFILGLTYQGTKDVYHVPISPDGPNYTTVKSSDAAIMMGVGRNIIIADRLLLTIEGDVNVPLTTIARTVHNGFYDTALGDNNLFREQNALDAMLVNIIQIKIGIGALVF
jgi:hypothetical protein